MRYPLLVLDHDDTVMDSTRSTHHPAFLDALSQMRPGVTISLEDYFRVNFEPGFLAYCEQELHFTEAEMEREYEIWQSWVRRRIPHVFPGVAQIIHRQIESGGRVAVVSHSVAANIRRDWAENGLPQPMLVFGWEQPRERRKPHPWPLQEILRKTGLSPSDLLMVDDLKPGFDMANAAGVDFAAALWAHDIPEIRTHMHHCCPVAFEDPTDLESWLFD
ncbi:MAG: HAD family hydrolase [Clostridiales bacterium]|nr:HAD family hydrolase [Clostridiales bacterium]